ncbi:MAG: 50S ribosome-binding GTPase [Nanoarchaeota archaeon]|jgi:ribosome-interacting GTPase 1|nr:50S ribosome-binding GTPase [Nanoarchaeota archaeon]
MPINVNDPEYVKAEKAFYEASTVEEQLLFLSKMISHMPGHKGAENLRQQLTTKRKRLEGQIEKKKKSGRGTKVGIRKDDMQAILVGKTNVGKSSLLNILTNAGPRVSNIKYTTNEPQVGMMHYMNCQVQIIEVPAVEGDYFDKSMAHTADTVLMMVDKFEDIKELEEKLYMVTGKIIIVLNKIDLLTPKEKRKLKARFQSNKYKFQMISCIPHWPENGIDELKKKIFESFDIIRVHTKEPGKVRSPLPVILTPDSTVKDVAEKILKGFSKRVKKIKIWGPGSKFGGQIVGLNHRLKDLVTVEFTTK